MKLNEIVRTDNFRQDEIIDWISRHCVLENQNGSQKANVHVKLNDKGEVDVSCDVIMKTQISSLAFQFGTIDGTFTASDSLCTLKGVPRKCTKFWCHSKIITSFEDIPECDRLILNRTGLKNLNDLLPRIKGNLDTLRVMHCDFRTLVDIDVESVKYSISYLHLSSNLMKEGGLGLLLIPGIKTIGGATDESWTSGYKAIEIIAKYAGKGEDGLIECQSELIENGLEEYAVL